MMHRKKGRFEYERKEEKRIVEERRDAS